MNTYCGSEFCWMKTDEGIIGYHEASSMGFPPGQRLDSFSVKSYVSGVIETFSYAGCVGSFDNLEFRYISKNGYVIHITND
jgi:hypothetical protein